jgi:transketolase
MCIRDSIRVGRNPVEDVYKEEPEFIVGKAHVLREGKDISLIASGETVGFIKKAAELLAVDGIDVQVINMHTIKPLDTQTIINSARKTGKVITVEEHSIFNGLGAAVAEVLIQNYPVPMKILGIPDEPAIAGTSAQVYAHYGLDAAGIAAAAKEMLK